MSTYDMMSELYILKSYTVKKYFAQLYNMKFFVSLKFKKNALFEVKLVQNMALLVARNVYKLDMIQPYLLAPVLLNENGMSHMLISLTQGREQRGNSFCHYKVKTLNNIHCLKF